TIRQNGRIVRKGTRRTSPVVSSSKSSISYLVTSAPGPGHGESSGRRVREGWGANDGPEPGEEFPAVRHGECSMASVVQKVSLTSSQDIPFNKLTLSKSNVRRIVAGPSIDELAEDIARRTLLQSLSVRPARDAEGNETGMFEVQAGGRRYRALQLLVKQ